MPYEEIASEDLEAARDIIKRDLSQEEIAMAQGVANRISREVEAKGSFNQAEALLNSMTNDQLRYIIVHSECYNMQYSAILEIFDQRGRQDKQSERLARSGLIEAAVFVTTTEPDRMSRVRF